MINTKHILFTVAIISMSFSLITCSKVSFVKLPDYHIPADEEYLADNTTTSDKGFKSPKKYDGYSMVWNDEFDAGPDIDTNNWSRYIAGDGGGNNELQYYTDSRANSYIKDGYLFIKAKKQKHKHMEYTSGKLTTKKKGDWKYCRVDVRAKLPTQQGIWPAIWMLPTDEVYGGWPKSGEIDIMESIGNEPKKIFGTIHYGPDWPKNQHAGNEKEVAEENVSSVFRVYSIEWEEGVIRWYINNELFSTMTTKDLGSHKWPFDQNFHLIMNLAVGGNWPGPPDNTTEFPKYLFVDYVRVFQKN